MLKITEEILGNRGTAAYFEKWKDEVFSENQKLYRFFLDLTNGFIRGDVLDLGCGSRIYYDTSMVKRWTGVDLSPHLLQNICFIGGVPPKGPIEMVRGDCRALDFPDASFDFVCAIFSFHHLARDTRSRSRQVITDVMRQSHRVLRQDGTLVVLESWPHLLLHIYGLTYSFAYPMAHALFGVELPLFFTSKQFARMARTAGFARCHILAAPIYDASKYPVSGWTAPAWIQRVTHKYGLYLYKKT